MDYNRITSFLDKFKSLLFKKQKDYRIIIETVTRHISFPITEEMVKIKGTTIYIQGSPILKNEIMIHKSGIISDLAQIAPGRHFTDIR